MKISIIAAIGRNRELGKDNKLLWHIPEDLERFKVITTGHAVIMGRKTFESLEKPLPRRLNIIITRDQEYQLPRGAAKVMLAGSLEHAIEAARSTGDTEVFIIGGGQVYQQALPLADKLYLTIVDAAFDADTFFPDYSQFTKVTFEKPGTSGEYRFRFIELER